MLYVKHQPLFGEMANIGRVNFSTELYSYCEHEILPDSVIVYLRVDSGDYTGYNMTLVDENIWEATVTGLPGGLIEYYIFAADESGRRECHPYIGAPDPHKFNLIGDPLPVPVLSLDKTSSLIELSDYIPESAEDYIILSNIGNAELTFEIQDIDFPTKFTVTPDHGIVQPGNSQTLVLIYDFHNTKDAEYQYEGSFKILSNDPLNQEFKVSLYVTMTSSVNDGVYLPIHIYPNPANTVVNISYNRANPTKACIYNLLGTQIKEATLIQGLNTIDIQDIPAGVYFIRIDAEAYKLIKH
jgi:hypothetical protein